MLYFLAILVIIYSSYFLIYKSNSQSELTFGEELGESPNGIICYSCYGKNNPSLDSYVKVGGISYYCGKKWQCVEYARRYLILTYGVIFENIGIAFDLYNSQVLFTNIGSMSIARVSKQQNRNTKILPEIGNLLVWSRETRFITGHVAVITAVDNFYVYICEQNWNNTKFDSDCKYSRKLPINVDTIGNITVTDVEYDDIIGLIKLII